MAASSTAAKREPPKLRDSCNPCAASKIKCTKEKPICARCTKRGQRCEYFATRRAGRKHEPQPPKPAPSSVASSRDSSSDGDADDASDARSSVQVAVSLATDANSHFTPESWDVCMSDALEFHVLSPSDALGDDTPRRPPEETTPWDVLSSAGPLLDAGSNDLFATQIPFHNSDASNQLYDSVTAGSVKSTSNDESNPFDVGDYSIFLLGDSSIILGGADLDSREPFKFPMTWDAPSSPSGSSLSSLPSSARPNASTAYRLSTTNSPDSDAHDFSATLLPAAAPDSSGCCLIRALELLKKLFPGSASCTCHDASGTDAHSTRHQVPTIQRVITENKKTLEAIQAMLQCPCSDADSSYLLAVISLVVFKVLGWYKATVKDLPGASCAMPSWSDSPESPGSDRARSDRSRPSTFRNRRRPSCHAEQVLQTPAIIDGYRLDGDDQARMSAQLVLSELHRVQRLINVLASRLKPENVELDIPDTPFFSPAWFGHLEVDLRKRVRILSHEIVELLKR